jgi:hypothetical protein
VGGDNLIHAGYYAENKLADSLQWEATAIQWMCPSSPHPKFIYDLCFKGTIYTIDYNLNVSVMVEQ